MSDKRAVLVLGITSLLTLGTVGYLGYRLYQQVQGPSQEELAQQVRASRQVSTETAQTGADALLALTLNDLHGKPQALARWGGKVRIINYWASWCPPCVEEMPMFSRLQERFAGHGVQVVGVGMDEVEKMQAFVQKSPVTYPLLVGTAGRSDNPGLTVRGLPYTLVVDRAGKVAFSLYGTVSEAELEKAIAPLLVGDDKPQR